MQHGLGSRRHKSVEASAKAVSKAVAQYNNELLMAI